MVRLTKRPLPEGITIESEQDYRKGEVLITLAEDCNMKCYICEDKPTTINVEHIVPHRNDIALKYAWTNLFIACGHCNSIKGMKFNNIIKPTECEPEDHIALSVEIMENMIEKVVVEALSTDCSTLQTAELLNFVYNGGTTDIKDIECSNLRNHHLLPNLRIFLQYIRNYLEEPNLGYDEIIRNEIDRSSAFAAFKRKIVRDDPILSTVFTRALQ